MPLDASSSPPPASSSTLRRIGTLAARGWQLKLYAFATEAHGLRPEDLAAADRAFGAAIAAPGTSSVAGFALLRPGYGAGELAFSAFWWEGAVLHRASLLLTGTGGPPRRVPANADRIGSVDELMLMAREAAAWRRCVLDANPPAPTAYLAECCA